jgi:hypothetical protein
MSLRTLFFLVNFAGSIGFMMMMAAVIGEALGGNSDVGMAAIAAVAFFGPALLIAVGEWYGYMRKSKYWEQGLGVFYGMLGVMFLVGTVLSVLGVKEDPKAHAEASLAFWVVYLSISLSVITYLIWCCWYRMMRRVPRNFSPVGPLSAVPTAQGDSSNPIT